MDAPIVAAISIYPIKSLDPANVSEIRILPSGSLEHDREFALFDDKGDWINGKRDARIHRVRATYDLQRFSVTLSETGSSQPHTFHLIESRHELEDWFGEFFGFPVSVQRNVETGFPDDMASPGPTIISSATLREVGSWFKIADRRELRRRFRANIELETETPFWEDRLFGADDRPVRFSIGDVAVQGINPCQRCAVPSRNPETGEVIPDFQRDFMRMREATLPAGVEKSRFTHYYRLTVNTRIPASEAGKVLRVGDSVLL